MTHQETFRQELIDTLRRELVGPDLPPRGTEIPDGETYAELLEESPIQRYSAGVLFPTSQQINEIDNTDESEMADDVSDGDIPEIRVEDQAADVMRNGRRSDQLADACDETIRMANEYFPSAMGLTFLVEHPEDGMVITARAAIYRSQAPGDPNNHLRQWRRAEVSINPVTLKFPVMALHDMQQFSLADDLRLRAIYHRRDDGSFLVTISILNTKVASPSKPPSGSDCFFQVGFEVTEAHGRYVFKEYRVLRRVLNGDTDNVDDREESVLELLYRKRRGYAVGHGCSADWGDDSEGHTNCVKTSMVPQFKVPPVEPRTIGGDELNMYFLSGADGTVPPASVLAKLTNLADGYDNWISERRSEIRLCRKTLT